MSWDSLGLVSAVISWVGLLFLIWKWKRDGSMTFSQHAAQYRSSRLFYALLWTVCLPPLFWFMVFPFAEKLALGLFFKVLVGLACVAMFIAATVPETTGWRIRVHRFSAFSMAILFVPILLTVLLAGLSKLVLFFIFPILLFMIWSIMFFVRHNAQHPRLLVAQALYIFVFHVSIFLAYYF